MPEMRPNTTPSDESSALNNALVESVALPRCDTGHEKQFTSLLISSLRLRIKGKKINPFYGTWVFHLAFGHEKCCHFVPSLEEE